MAKDRTTTYLLLGAGAVVLYVLYQGRYSAGNAPNPRPIAPGSLIYTRPGQVGAPATPWGLIAQGAAKVASAVGLDPSSWFAPGSTDAPTPSSSAEASSSLADIIRSNLPGDLTVYPPDILNGGITGTTNDPANPGSFFGIDESVYAGTPDIDFSSTFDAQSYAMAFA